MSKRFTVVDLDRMVQSSPIPITILNDLPSETEDDRKAIDSLILTTYDNTDILSTIPSCQCGRLSMGYNLGKECTVCNTLVSRPVETPITANVWLRCLDGVDGFIAPVAWIMLTSALSSTGYNLMEWLTNPMSRPPNNCSQVIQKKIQVFEQAGWERGLNNFIRNFDRFLEILPALKLNGETELVHWLQTNRSVLFPKHLPMPTKALLVLEKTAVGSFADLPMTGAIDAARTIVSLSKGITAYTQNYIERKMVAVIKNISTYLWDTINLSFNRKRGWLRGQLFRSRSHFCMRGVITSITVPHNYEEIWIPWAQGLELLKIHIISKLLKRGYSATNAFSLVEANGNVYVPILDEIMQELIRESDYLGIPCTFQRNPTLTRASSQCLFITRVKTDIYDNTISWSVLCTTGANRSKRKLSYKLSGSQSFNFSSLNQ